MRPLVAGLAIVVGCSSPNGEPSPAGADAAVDVASDTYIHVHDAQPETGDAGVYDGPETLAETGLYSDLATKTLATTVVAYDVRYPLWSDALEKSRFLALPSGATIDTTDPDHWSYPVGTKVWKEFRQGTRRLETRYLEKRASGWLRVTFGWDATESSAVAIPEGAVDYGGTNHDLPDRETCDRCHDGLPGNVLGLDPIQLAPVIDDWNAKGMFSKPVAPKEVPGTGTTQEALGYLHGNCGGCHNDVGIWSTVTTMRLRLRTTDTTPEGTWAYTTTRGTIAHHTMPGGIDTIVVPGVPEKSQLWARMGKRDFWAMPPVGSEVVDDLALLKVRDWISAMK